MRVFFLWRRRLLRRQSCISRACPAHLERIIAGIELRIWDFRYGYFAEPIFFGPVSDHCLPLSRTAWLTHCCWVDLTDVTLAVEDAYVDIQGSVSDWLVTTDSLEIANQVRQQLHNSFWTSTSILQYFVSPLRIPLFWLVCISFR